MPVPGKRGARWLWRCMLQDAVINNARLVKIMKHLIIRSRQRLAGLSPHMKLAVSGRGCHQTKKTRGANTNYGRGHASVRARKTRSVDMATRLRRRGGEGKAAAPCRGGPARIAELMELGMNFRALFAGLDGAGNSILGKEAADSQRAAFAREGH